MPNPVSNGRGGGHGASHGIELGPKAHYLSSMTGPIILGFISDDLSLLVTARQPLVDTAKARSVH